jgi:transposase
MSEGKVPRYSAEFKQEAMRLARTSGQKQKELAKALGVSDRQLRRWLRENEPGAASKFALSAIERAELKRLRKQVAIMKEEQEILRKAAAFFAKETR